ncbi:MAG: riboflavin kinase [Candidatus Yanofskybacteria bacterium]|nr:riboflavin kinase [Candidatus Yanofskybacteria bacterium]
MRKLDRPILLTGSIVQGRGSGMRFPTATLQTDTELPEPGVYVSRVILRDRAEWYEGATSVGVASTVGAVNPTVETHLFDFTGNLVGDHVELELLSFIRPMETFRSMRDMEEEIERDITLARDFFRSA